MTAKRKKPRSYKFELLTAFRKIVIRWSLPKGQIAVWLVLYDYADKDGYAWPSVRRIAEELGAREKHVKSWLADLQTNGLLWVDPEGRKGGRPPEGAKRRGAIRRLLMPSDAETVPDSGDRFVQAATVSLSSKPRETVPVAIGETVPETAPKRSQKCVAPYKEEQTSSEQTKSEQTTAVRFEEFRKAYPERLFEHERECLGLWRKHRLDDEADVILEAIERDLPAVNSYAFLTRWEYAGRYGCDQATRERILTEGYKSHMLAMLEAQ